MEALKTSGGQKCASRILKRVALNETKDEQPRSGHCVKAKKLAAAGQEERAEASYAKALEAEPNSTCASGGLADLKDSEDCWDWIVTAAKVAAAALVLVGIGLALLALVLWILIQVLTRIPHIRTLRPVQWLVRSGLEVKPMDDAWMAQGVGAQVASLIRIQITPSRGVPGVVNGYPDLSDRLKPIADISPEARVVIALASVLSVVKRKHRFEVVGSLQPKSKRGPGLSIELTCEKTQVASTTLWWSEFKTTANEVDAFRDLAAPAAGWLEHHIAKHLKDDGELLSEDALSWAFFKAGFARKGEGRLAETVALYRRALDQDAGNVGALNNLGVMQMDGREYVETQKSLSAAVDLLPDRPPRRWYRLIRSKKRMPRERAWYAAHFNSSALAINRSDAVWSIEARGSKSAGKRIDVCGPVDAAYQADAHDSSRRVALQALERLRSRRPFRARADLRQRLERKTIPHALLIYAAASPDRDGTNPATPPKDRRALRQLLSSRQLTGGQALAYVDAEPRPSPAIHVRFADAHAHRGETTRAIARLRKALDASYADERKSSLAKSMLEDPAFDRLLKTHQAKKLRKTLEKLAGETLKAIEQRRCPRGSSQG